MRSDKIIFAKKGLYIRPLLPFSYLWYDYYVIGTGDPARLSPQAKAAAAAWV